MRNFYLLLIGEMNMEEVDVAWNAGLNVFEGERDKGNGGGVVVKREAEGTCLPALMIFPHEIWLGAGRTKNLSFDHHIRATAARIELVVAGR